MNSRTHSLEKLLSASEEEQQPSSQRLEDGWSSREKVHASVEDEEGDQPPPPPPQNPPPPASPANSSSSGTKKKKKKKKKRTIQNNNTHVNHNTKRPKMDGDEKDDIDNDNGKKKSVDGGDSKKKHFRRVWIAQDEVTILEGLMNFTPKIGTPGIDPAKFITTFYNHIKKDLHFAADRTQFSAKIRKLRDKYYKTAESGCPIFNNPHQEKLFQLSKEVWRNLSIKEEGEEENEVVNQQKFNGNLKRESGKKVEMTDKEVGVGDSSLVLSEMFSFDKRFSLNVLNEEVVKTGIGLIGESKKAELECRWKKIQVAELELFVNRVQLIKDQSTLILEAYKSSNHYECIE